MRKERKLKNEIKINEKIKIKKKKKLRKERKIKERKKLNNKKLKEKNCKTTYQIWQNPYFIFEPGHNPRIDKNSNNWKFMIW